MEPHSGEIYTVQQGPGGVRMAKSSRVRVSQQEEMMGHRRPTHVSEARLETLETNLWISITFLLSTFLDSWFKEMAVSK